MGSDSDRPMNMLRQTIERIGFRPLVDSAYENLERVKPEVVFIAPAHDSIPSASGNAIYVLVEQLAAGLGRPSAILSRWPVNGEPARCQLSERILYFRSPMRPGLLERRLPHRVKMFLWGSEVLHHLRYAKACGSVAKALGAKVVVVEDTPAFCPMVRVAAGHEVKILLHQHCDKPRVLYRPTWARIVKSIDGINFVAKQGRQIAEAKHGSLPCASSVTYCGVDLNHYSPEKWAKVASSIGASLGIPPQAKVLLFLGRIVPEKGIAEAAEAFNRAAGPDHHFIVIGSHDPQFCRDLNYLERLRVAASQSSGRIHLVGVVSQEMVPAYYELADAVIIPSIGGEGLPKVVIEALAMGRPVVASDRGGIWELLDSARNGWMIEDPRDVTKIAAQIQVALSDATRLATMRANILAVDRPLMCEKRMVLGFADVIESLLLQ